MATPEEIDAAISRWAWNLKPFVPTQGNYPDWIVGEALRKIRDKRLHRGTHDDFYLYCAERWGLIPQEADRYMGITDNSCQHLPVPKPGRERHEMIYFLRHEDLVKIGYSCDVASRIKSISAMSPVSLALMGTCSGGRDKERSIHQDFAHCHSHGEWFYLAPELLKFIQEEAKDEQCVNPL